MNLDTKFTLDTRGNIVFFFDSQAAFHNVFHLLPVCECKNALPLLSASVTLIWISATSSNCPNKQADNLAGVESA